MHITDAARICHPGPQDQTLDLADTLIGEARLNEAREMKQADVSAEYRVAARELERIAVNLVAHARGMVGKQVVPSYIKEARAALDIMEGAL